MDVEICWRWPNDVLTRDKKVPTNYYCYKVECGFLDPNYTRLGPLTSNDHSAVLYVFVKMYIRFSSLCVVS